METIAVVLGVLAVLGCGAAIWLALGRSGLMAQAAGERAARENAERARDEGRAEIDRLNARINDLVQTHTRLATDRATLEQQLQSEKDAHRETRANFERSHARELEQLEERLNAEVAHAEEVAKEKLDAVVREKASIEKKLNEFDLKLREAFGSLAADALKSNREQFLALAEQKLDAKKGAIDEMVKPIAETLKRTDAKLAVIEQAGTELKSETGKLVRALREPHVRGRYGEIQLQRVAELAGMSAYCDFTPQDQTRDIDGNALRPDMVVKMPSNRTVVVDAKTNIQGYLDALSAATPEEQEKHLLRFARHVGEQATALAKKKYWTQYDGSPEFVVMFIPGDQFIDAALQRQPEILEKAAEQGVILASPATLIGLLRAVAVGYKEQQLAQAAEELREIGKELHERVAVAMSYAAKLGKSLGAAVESYNDFVGSYQSRMEPAIRKFEQSGVKSAKELPDIGEMDVRVRRVAVDKSVERVQGEQMPLLE